MELVEKKELFDGSLEFVKWTDFEEDSRVEVYIEKSIVPELEEKDRILIDAAIGEVNNKKIAMLFIKRENPDMYG